MQHRVFPALPRLALARRALLLGLAYGCTPAGSDGAPCQKDTDCKGDRLCGPDGKCIDPAGTTGGSTATSTPTGGGPDATTSQGATSDATSGDATSSDVTGDGLSSGGGPSTGDTAGTSGGAVDFDNACACEACGGHGTCVLAGDAPSCQCDPGYVAAGLDCTPAPGSFGATYFVSPGGSDANPGTSEQEPLKTIAKALSLAKAGDAVRLAPGATFTEAINLAKGSGGQPGQPITITSDPVDRATLKIGAGTPAIYLYDASFVTIENLVVSGPGPGATTKEGIGMMSDGAHEGITVRNVDVS